MSAPRGIDVPKPGEEYDQEPIASAEGSGIPRSADPDEEPA